MSLRAGPNPKACLRLFAIRLVARLAHRAELLTMLADAIRVVGGSSLFDLRRVRHRRRRPIRGFLVFASSPEALRVLEERLELLRFSRNRGVVGSLGDCAVGRAD